MIGRRSKHYLDYLRVMYMLATLSGIKNTLVKVTVIYNVTIYLYLSMLGQTIALYKS